MNDQCSADEVTQISVIGPEYSEVSHGKVTNMMHEREHDQSSASDDRIFFWWVAGHVVLFVAIAAYPVYLLAVSGIQPSVALIGGLAVVLAMNLELILLMRGLKRGVVRRIASRYDWTTEVLAMVYMVMFVPMTVSTFANYSLAFSSWSRFSGQFLPGLGTIQSSTIVFMLVSGLCTYISGRLVRRLRRVQQLRKDHCINCGYPFDPDGELCSECGCARWHEA